MPKERTAAVLVSVLLLCVAVAVPGVWGRELERVTILYSNNVNRQLEATG